MSNVQVDGRDIPIAKLVPLAERPISKSAYKKIAASIRAVGLLDPLIVYAEKSHYVILDGQIRHRILLELGAETVPCLVWKEREAFTANRMVNRLSRAQEARMIRNSLEELDEGTIAKTFGLSQIRHRLNGSLLQKLHPKVSAAYEAERLTTPCAKELAFVIPKRQEEILKVMEGCNDYGVTMARALILKTPPGQRAKVRSGTKTPWSRNGRHTDLLKKLQEAEELQDFYSTIYRQYSINLLKLVVYVRRLLVNQRVRDFLMEKYPDTVIEFESIIAGAEGVADE